MCVCVFMCVSEYAAIGFMDVIFLLFLCTRKHNGVINVANDI